MNKSVIKTILSILIVFCMSFIIYQYKFKYINEPIVQDDELVNQNEGSSSQNEEFIIPNKEPLIQDTAWKSTDEINLPNIKAGEIATQTIYLGRDRAVLD